MRKQYGHILNALLLAMVCSSAAAELVVDDAALSDESSGTNWLGHGRTYSEQRYSPLTQINADNVNRLGLAWSLDLPGERSLNATPLAVDGVLYFSGTYGVVTAVDARTGKLLWRFDPETIEHSGERLRLLWGTSRGVAYWKGSVFVGTGDGRLIAIDAKTGKQRWSTLTTDPEEPLYITGAPRVFNDKVVIGNGGTELGSVRGYATAYDTRTGEQVWRFYTVPGNPADGFEDAAQSMAANTWTGEWWIHGGGGTVWNAMTYDPEFNLVYLGTGNGSPWNRKIRSPDGGDNLFLCSIVAVDADTGEYRWHYQTTPGESWDYNSAQDMILVDLTLGGRTIKGLVHAPKNGFFYVLDRSNGTLLSGKPYTKTTWATKIDLKSGRPIEVAGARYENGEATVWPGPPGGHSWEPMSYNPKTGLVYLPYNVIPGYYNDKGIKRTEWRATRFEFSTGVRNDTSLGDSPPGDAGSAALGAWDPIAGEYRWTIPKPVMGNPGTMTTAGGLVFQGSADGTFSAYDATTGETLWDYATGLGISAPAVTYKLAGKQNVALLVGWGGAQVMLGGNLAARHGWEYGRQTRRLLSFVLDGRGQLPKNNPPSFAQPLQQPEFELDADLVAKGLHTYTAMCAWCHGPGVVAGGGTPDLRASPIVTDTAAFKRIVVGGERVTRGMPEFSALTQEDLDALQHFIRSKARLVFGNVDAN